SADLAERRFDFDARESGKPSRDVYNEFTGRMLEGGLAELFREYAALARLLTSSTMLWVDAASELIQRFERDRGAICQALAIGGNSDVVGIEACATDPHNGRRRVVMLKLGNGERVIYKPRSMK